MSIGLLLYIYINRKCSQFTCFVYTDIVKLHFILTSDLFNKFYYFCKYRLKNPGINRQRKKKLRCLIIHRTINHLQYCFCQVMLLCTVCDVTLSHYIRKPCHIHHLCFCFEFPHTHQFAWVVLVSRSFLQNSELCLNAISALLCRI